MSTSHRYNGRRAFLKKSSLLFTSLGLGAGNLLVSCSNETTSDKGIKQAGGIALRKNIAGLKADDPEIKLLKDAITILKKRSLVSPLDPMGWDTQALLHATFCATSMYVNQVHYSWYVWPWHRLYLWSMEQKLQKAVSEPTLALHYWDWTKANEIPAHYWGADNPLNNVTRLVRSTDKIPADFINVGAAFRASAYKTFGGYPAVTKIGESQMDGIAEQTFHNNIHNWIGGQMATFTESGFDPIFYGHHGNCDRIWEAWRKYSTENMLPADDRWLNKKLYSTDGNGKPVDFKISELLDTKELGYTFEDLNLNPVFCNPFEEESLPIRTITKADCIVQLPINPQGRDAIFKEFNNKERAHVILHFERAQLPYQPYCARVFFEYELDGKRQSTYTGTFTILPIQDIDTVLLQNGVFLQLEVPAAIAMAVSENKKMEVVFQPVPLPNRNIPDVSLKLENITLKTAL